MKQKNKIDILEILIFIIIIILIYMVLTRIFGNSATEIQIYLGFISGFLIIAGYVIKLNSNFSKLNREVGEIKIQTINSFNKIKQDLNKIKNYIKK